ncbi:REX3 [[Candida] subhashii]|uniref:RNA exonuclease 3 n=1 Tax=[Candida] subhashii TaxID=561895 RepID=A0A8J5UJ21_9ASCO|nr:REX3 [[Candida] subhashii]KAG7660676.1 REX3 [[Candida] subhashii]
MNRSYFQQFECPSTRNNKICDNPDCMFSHRPIQSNIADTKSNSQTKESTQPNRSSATPIDLTKEGNTNNIPTIDLTVESEEEYEPSVNVVVSRKDIEKPTIISPHSVSSTPLGEEVNPSVPRPDGVISHSIQTRPTAANYNSEFDDLQILSSTDKAKPRTTYYQRSTSEGITLPEGKPPIPSPVASAQGSINNVTPSTTKPTIQVIHGGPPKPAIDFRSPEVINILIRAAEKDQAVNELMNSVATGRATKEDMNRLKEIILLEKQAEPSVSITRSEKPIRNKKEDNMSLLKKKKAEDVDNPALKKQRAEVLDHPAPKKQRAEVLDNPHPKKRTAEVLDNPPPKKQMASPIPKKQDEMTPVETKTEDSSSAWEIFRREREGLYNLPSKKQKIIPSDQKENDNKSTEPEATEDPKYITPKQVKNNPATIQVRKQFIEMIVTTLLKKDPTIKLPKTKAIEYEFDLAQKATSGTYTVLMKQLIHRLSKAEKPTASQENTSRKHGDLDKWIIPVQKLEKFGYIMKKPEPSTEKPFIRTCVRCRSQFRADQQSNNTICNYHSGKIMKNDRNERVYECCLGNENESYCETAKHHVFILDTPELKHAFIPYQFTRDIFKKKSQYIALGLDCEMGYTTNGFELLRITAVDYFTTKIVLDVYVNPKGRVVDFNTKFSGISELTDDFVSFEESIKKLGEVMDANTILIGHGLENDLNALRLIHENVIDTAILFPKYEASPKFRWSLKRLAFKYLSRNIQTGEHDSTEDAIAAIDIVKHFAAR